MHAHMRALYASSLPALGDRTSMVTLSVSICAMASSCSRHPISHRVKQTLPPSHRRWPRLLHSVASLLQQGCDGALGDGLPHVGRLHRDGLPQGGARVQAPPARGAQPGLQALAADGSAALRAGAGLQEQGHRARKPVRPVPEHDRYPRRGSCLTAAGTR